MERPKNLYREGTAMWELMEYDWSDKDARQIAEALFITRGTVNTYISRIRRDTGYEIPHIKGRAGRPHDG